MDDFFLIEAVEGGVLFKTGKDGRLVILALLFGLAGGLPDRLPPDDGRLDGVSSAMVLAGLVCCAAVGVRVTPKLRLYLDERRCKFRVGERRPLAGDGDGLWNSASSALESTRLRGGRFDVGKLLFSGDGSRLVDPADASCMSNVQIMIVPSDPTLTALRPPSSSSTRRTPLMASVWPHSRSMNAPVWGW